MVARSARSSSPSDCRRVFIWFTGPRRYRPHRRRPTGAQPAIRLVSPACSVDCAVLTIVAAARPDGRWMRQKVGDERGAGPAGRRAVVRAAGTSSPRSTTSTTSASTASPCCCATATTALAEDAVTETFLRDLPERGSTARSTTSSRSPARCSCSRCSASTAPTMATPRRPRRGDRRGAGRTTRRSPTPRRRSSCSSSWRRPGSHGGGAALLRGPVVRPDRVDDGRVVGHGEGAGRPSACSACVR